MSIHHLTEVLSQMEVGLDQISDVPASSMTAAERASVLADLAKATAALDGLLLAVAATEPTT